MARFPPHRIALMILALLAFLFFFYRTHRRAPAAPPRRAVQVIPVTRAPR